jgi:hypothetical protein
MDQINVIYVFVALLPHNVKDACATYLFTIYFHINTVKHKQVVSTNHI